jgi:hypothetical protein
MSDTGSEPIATVDEIDGAVSGNEGAGDLSTRRGSPGWVIWLLIVLATIVGMAATLNGWINRQALDTDEWVSVTDEMLADDDIRGALSIYLTSQLFENVDVASELESLLPGPTAQLAGPLAATLQSNAVNLVDQLLASDRFGSLWTSVNRTAHTAFVTLANGDDVGSMSTAGGAFVVDMRELLVNLADRLGLPGAAVDRIPEGAGQLVVFESDQIDALQQFVRFVDMMSIFLFVLVIVLYAVAVYLARDRRSTLRNVGVSIVVGSLLLLVIQRITINVSVDELARAENSRAAVGSIVSIATGLLNELAWAWLAIGVVITLFAVLVGPSRVAVAVRKFLSPVMIHPVGAWALALGALGLYLLLAPGFSFQRWLPVIVLGVLFVTAVEMLRRQICREHAAAPAPAES